MTIDIPDGASYVLQPQLGDLVDVIDRDTGETVGTGVYVEFRRSLEPGPRRLVPATMSYDAVEYPEQVVRHYLSRYYIRKAKL